jgi:hypothetical protein
MKLELTIEQVVVLNTALLTRARTIEKLLHSWKTSDPNEDRKYLIEAYSKELKSVNDLSLIIK